MIPLLIANVKCILSQKAKEGSWEFVGGCVALRLNFAMEAETCLILHRQGEKRLKDAALLKLRIYMLDDDSKKSQWESLRRHGRTMLTQPIEHVKFQKGLVSF